MAEPRLTFRRLVGLDRSVVPAETARDQPLRPFTIPNAIGLLRFAGLPVFLIVAFSSGDGVSFHAAAIYFAIAGADYLDGMAARLTGQYSRFGALLDPLVDRLLVLAGVAVSWNFELLPRWLLGVLAARELFMLVMSQIALRRGQDVSINWVGRWAVWPTMSALFLAMLYPGLIASLVFGLGVLMSLLATALYVRVALQWEGPPSTSS